MNEDHCFGGRRIERVNITTRAAEVARACSETGAGGNFGYFRNGNQWYAEIVTFILHCPSISASGVNLVAWPHKQSKVLRDCRLSTFLPRLIREPQNAAAGSLRDNDPADCAKDSLLKQQGRSGSLRKSDVEASQTTADQIIRCRDRVSGRPSPGGRLHGTCPWHRERRTTCRCGRRWRESPTVRTVRERPNHL